MPIKYGECIVVHNIDLCSNILSLFNLFDIEMNINENSTLTLLFDDDINNIFDIKDGTNNEINNIEFATITTDNNMLDICITPFNI